MHWTVPRRLTLAVVFLTALRSTTSAQDAPPRAGADPLPTPAEMADARTDVWGERSLKEPDGPSYEFFKDLLPPLRYVDTAFRHYPIELGAPAGRVKARWVSDGGSVNARADKKPMWKEAGVPVRILVGEAAKAFGGDVTRLDGPRYAEGCLPIVQVGDSQGQTVYRQEAFGAARGSFAEHGAVFLRFKAEGAAGTVAVRLDLDGPARHTPGAIADAEGRGLILHDPSWTWNDERKELRAKLEAGQSAILTVLTQPLPPPWPALREALYDEERQACVETWKALLARGCRLSIPEPIVQDAWRSLVVGNFLLAVGDRMHYSAGNAYDHLYEAECGDATRALMLFGYTGEARGMVGPLLDFQRQATRFHVAGHKLQLLSHYYWVTRDADYLRAKEPAWAPVVDMILKERQPKHGLLPPDRYAGDISQEVYSLNSNAASWRGLRDLSAVLAEMGEAERSRMLGDEARAYREAIVKAVAESEQRDTVPPFIPNALFGAERAYDPLTATRLGSYYDLMAPYIIGSTVFGPGSEREGWMIGYLQQHGGIAMGMIRSTPHQGQFNGMPGVNPLYGLRYMLALLRRDDRDHALVGFYGQLAQGMTRGTFIGGEGSRFLHGDQHGRSFYLPPNSASNAMFLTTLRYLLVQDWDLDDDGRPETLRLLYGAPGRWLRDGAVLEFERTPTMFGPLSLKVESRLARGEVQVDVDSPPRRPGRTLLRLPLPAGWRAESARIGADDVPLAKDGALDLSSRTGRFQVRVRVVKK